MATTASGCLPFSWGLPLSSASRARRWSSVSEWSIMRPNSFLGQVAARLPSVVVAGSRRRVARGRAGRRPDLWRSHPGHRRSSSGPSRAPRRRGRRGVGPRETGRRPCPRLAARRSLPRPGSTECLGLTGERPLFQTPPSGSGSASEGLGELLGAYPFWGNLASQRAVQRLRPPGKRCTHSSGRRRFSGRGSPSIPAVRPLAASRRLACARQAEAWPKPCSSTGSICGSWQRLRAVVLEPIGQDFREMPGLLGVAPL